MKKKIVLFLFLFFTALSFYDVSSRPAGIAGRIGSGILGDGNNCAQSCHGSLVGSINGTPTGAAACTVTAAIVGLTPGAKYELSKTYQGYVDIVATGRHHWGLESMIVKTSGDNAGVIVLKSTNDMHVMTVVRFPYIRRYMVHTDAIGNCDANGATIQVYDHYRFNFQWVSPATPVGNITFYWIGMATNNDCNDGSSDWIGTGNYTYSAPF